MTRRWIVLVFVVLFLASCDVANDPVRLGKQAVSEANAYAIETEADQAALDAEQARLTKERQDAITVQERAQREAITTQQIGKVAPWLGGAIVLASIGFAAAVVLLMVGNASANVLSQNAKAIREMRRAMETYPDARGNYPLLNVPAGVKISVYNPNVESAHNPHRERSASRPALEANNTLRAKTAIAAQQVSQPEYNSNGTPRAHRAELAYLDINPEKQPVEVAR